MSLFVLVVLILSVSVTLIILSSAFAKGQCELLESCTTNNDCASGLYCSSCPAAFIGTKCIRSTATNPFEILNNSLPFNKYAFLTTHNAFAIEGASCHNGGPRFTITNQEDTISEQLNNGVRALMLDTYDFDGDVWLCHSFGGKCHDYTAFAPAIHTFREIEAFLSANPAEIITIILEDYVESPFALTKVLYEADLMKFWFPVSRMPKSGQDWPFVSDMVANNQRLLVFTSIPSKEKTEGIAYQWNYMVENQYGDFGTIPGFCFNRAESAPLDDKSKSLVLVNYFKTIPIKKMTCITNSEGLVDMISTCYEAAGSRWPNFIAVDYYKRSEGGGSFEAVDMLNRKQLWHKHNDRH